MTNAVIAFSTNLTSFSVELVVYDGLISVSSSNTMIATSCGCVASLTCSAFQQDSISWGTRLPVSFAGAYAVSTLTLDAGYLHPGEHHYQTVVLYNRNPVPVGFTLHSSLLPQVTLSPVYRSTLTNQTVSQAFSPGRSGSGAR